MVVFKNALVRLPCRNMIHGLSMAALGRPNYKKAMNQHKAYVAALQSCGLAVMVLAADEAYPDSVFIEDTAVLSEKVAVITRPGASSRLGEEVAVAEALRRVYERPEYIIPPGTLDGGDVLRAGNRFFLGISARTNESGAGQLAAILAKNGYSATLVPLRHVLHLKTGIAYLENNLLLVSGEFVNHPQLGHFHVVPVADEESYAANSIWINGRVLVPAGFPQTKKKIEMLGYETLAVDVSEFRKLDGGLSCLSLRF
jgi:dimethylargininase